MTLKKDAGISEKNGLPFSKTRAFAQARAADLPPLPGNPGKAPENKSLKHC